MIKPSLLFMIVVFLVSLKITSQEIQEKKYNTFPEFLTEQNFKDKQWLK